jgi:CelD/BcsL family acetyltransferase involved in cellulose biosynthesis
VAAQYWVVGGGQAALLKLAHAEDQRAASPGTALTAIMIRRLLEGDGVRELDFGRGDDPYKRLWVGHRRQRIGVLLADPRHPAGLLALARQAAGRGRRHALGWLGRGSPAAEDWGMVGR